MMAAVNVDLAQLHTLAAQMAALGPRAELMAREVIRDAAERAEDRARDLVPYRTGDLHNSIYSKPIDSGLGFELGATMEYAGFVELGTSRMAPQPYIRPAFEHATSVGMATMNSLLGRML